jgi:magnesium-transporting ATPase (P-type)
MDRDIQGNATDGATLKFVELAREGLGSTINDVYPRVFQITFNSKNKWMLTLHKSGGSAAAPAVESAGDSLEFLMLVRCPTAMLHYLLVIHQR